ncbi:hypothetical protein BX600DRAFT_445653 [Xylariales sp. PMI_506]|nr:hypothetical protein BX600DRAFT_445653 [Xylariales sp. PMI_506]
MKSTILLSALILSVQALPHVSSTPYKNGDLEIFQTSGFHLTTESKGDLWISKRWATAVTNLWKRVSGGSSSTTTSSTTTTTTTTTTESDGGHGESDSGHSHHLTDSTHSSQPIKCSTTSAATSSSTQHLHI